MSKIKIATYKDQILTITYWNGKKEQYEGGCTVWYKLSDMNRCSSSKESWLHSIWKYIEHYKQPYIQYWKPNLFHEFMYWLGLMKRPNDKKLQNMLLSGRSTKKFNYGSDFTLADVDELGNLLKNRLN